MRSIKLVPVTGSRRGDVAARLAPTGAMAARHATTSTPRSNANGSAVPAATAHLKVNAPPRLVEAGETAIVFGQLICPHGGTGVAGQTVTVLEHPGGASATSTAGTTNHRRAGPLSGDHAGAAHEPLFTASAAGRQKRAQDRAGRAQGDAQHPTHRARRRAAAHSSGPGPRSEPRAGPSTHAVTFSGT